MSRRRRNNQDPLSVPDGDVGPGIAPIEATLEPPDDEDITRTRPSSDTVIINVDQRSQASGGQYLMVRPDKGAVAHLLVCMGANVGHRYAVNGTELVIGRSARCDVRIDDDRVSSRHAELVRRGGRFRIYDLGSSNGTLVNAQRIDEIDLRDGDLIQIGYTVFKYVSNEPDAPRHITSSGRTVLDAHAQQGLAPYVPAAAVRPGDGMLAPAAVGSGGLAGLGPPPAAPAMRARDGDDEVSLAELLAQLRRVIAFFWPYRWLIAGLGAIGFVAGGVSTIVAPPSVAAFFEVSLQSKASDNPIEKFSNANVEFFRSAATNFRSTGLIERSLQAVGTAAPPPALVQAVQNSLSFTNIGGTGTAQTYVGNYRGPTAEESLAFLEKHVELYLEIEIDKTLKIIRASVDFLKKQLADNEAELKRTEEALTKFKRENIDGLPDQAKQYYDYLFELQKRESDLTAEVSRLEAEAAVDARRVATETPLVESRVLATRPYQQAIVDVNRQLAEARARGLADDHPDIRQLNTKLEELRRLETEAKTSSDDTEVERARNPIYESSLDRLQRLRAASAATYQERARLKDDRERIKKIVDRLPELEAQFADLTRSYDATKELHTRIFDQLKTTQLQYELERASAAARYEIITPPRLEYVSPLRTFSKRAFMATVLGVAIGFALALAFQVRRLTAAWT